MFYHTYDVGGFDTLKEMLEGAIEELRDFRAEEVDSREPDPLFPQSFVMGEEDGPRSRYIYVPAAREAECGTEKGAWDATLQAYSDPSNVRFDGWESARFGEWDSLRQ